jgi:hypothetical protein
MCIRDSSYPAYFSVSSELIASGLTLNEVGFRLAAHFSGRVEVAVKKGVPEWGYIFDEVWTLLKRRGTEKNYDLNTLSKVQLKNYFRVDFHHVFSQYFSDGVSTTADEDEINAEHIQCMMRYYRDIVYNILERSGASEISELEKALCEGFDENFKFFQVMSGPLKLKTINIPEILIKRKAFTLVRKIMRRVESIYTANEKLSPSNAAKIADIMRSEFSNEYCFIKKIIDGYRGGFEQIFVSLFLDNRSAWRDFCECLMTDSMQLENRLPPDTKDVLLQPLIESYFDSLVEEASQYLRHGYRNLSSDETLTTARITQKKFNEIKQTAIMRGVDLGEVKKTLLKYFDDKNEYWGYWFNRIWKIHIEEEGRVVPSTGEEDISYTPEDAWPEDAWPEDAWPEEDDDARR